MSNLSDRAVLVSLNARAWRATATDRDIAHHTEGEYDAEDGTMKVIKELTPKVFIQPIHKIIALGRQEHYHITCMGFTKGQQLLSTALMEQYAMTQLNIRESFERSVEDFCKVYPEIIEGAPKRLGKAYKVSDFPTVDQIRGYFHYGYRFLPIPSTNDWRLEGLAKEDMGDLKSDVDDQVRDMFQSATKEVYERARDVLRKIADQARSYEPKFGGASLLRDATIQNLKEVSNLVIQMNVTNDPVLDQIGREMVTEFADLEAKELRKEETRRNEIASIAERIMKKMG